MGERTRAGWRARWSLAARRLSSGAMTPAQIIVLATPVFLGADRARVRSIGRGARPQHLPPERRDDQHRSGHAEPAHGRVHRACWRSASTSLVYEHVALWQPAGRFARGSGSVGLLFYDFCYYWLHRAGHRVALFWAAHVVHHQSEDYNLSPRCARPRSGCAARLGLLPADGGARRAAAGVRRRRADRPAVPVLGAHRSRWASSAGSTAGSARRRNHRVHHAVNDRYLDRNYGGILIVWDRLFGSFDEEDDDEPCVYGTRAPLRSWNPLWANLEVYCALAHDSGMRARGPTSCASGSSRRAGGRPTSPRAFRSRRSASRQCGATTRPCRAARRRWR